MSVSDDLAAEPLHPLTRAIHWFTVLAIVVLFVAVLVGADLEDPAQKKPLIALHQSLGLSVLLLNGLRLLWRWRMPLRSLIADPLKRRIGHANHLLVYTLLLAQPLLGWLYVSARGREVALWGLPLPALIAKDRALAEQVHDWHALGGWLLLALVGLHAAAALYHHYVLRDGVLRRMLTGRP
ncbi:MAG: cytochrome b/b6 domain-containing protein [Gammaproteobacteria bacterium]|jgi:cytochrome b561|nr:cytochrome b/b6 domain-containing protein [Gammaproteobacteria bacterium]